MSDKMKTAIGVFILGATVGLVFGIVYAVNYIF